MEGGTEKCYSPGWEWGEIMLYIKSRDITLPTKIHLIKAMVFSVVNYGCNSWTIKKAECRRIDASELWSWRRLLRVLDCKEIQPGLQGDPTSSS